MTSATTFYDFTPLNNRSEEKSLSDYRGKVVLVVNTASKCGFTKQYDGLEALYKSVNESHPDQFVILGFPCNQFGGQEPGSDDDIQEFCRLNHGVTFPLMKKVDVKGSTADPLFKWLTSEKRNWGMEPIKWNFEKFLINRDGGVKERWSSITGPESLKSSVLAELEKKATQPSPPPAAEPTPTATEPSSVPAAQPSIAPVAGNEA